MSLRAIFYVEDVVIRSNDLDDDGNRIRTGVAHLRAACKGPYKNWARYTPAGSIEMATLNPAGLAWFEERVGTDVAITFEDPTEADLAVE